MISMISARMPLETLRPVDGIGLRSRQAIRTIDGPVLVFCFYSVILFYSFCPFDGIYFISFSKDSYIFKICETKLVGIPNLVTSTHEVFFTF